MNRVFESNKSTLMIDDRISSINSLHDAGKMPAQVYWLRLSLWPLVADRAVFITSKTKSILCQEKIPLKDSFFGFYFPHDGYPNSNGFVKSIVGTLAFGVDTMLYDMNC